MNLFQRACLDSSALAEKALQASVSLEIRERSTPSPQVSMWWAHPGLYMRYVGKRTYNHFKTDTFYGVKLTGIRRCSADFSSISWLEIGQYYPDSQPGMHLTMEKLSKYSYEF